MATPGELGTRRMASAELTGPLSNPFSSPAPPLTLTGLPPAGAPRLNCHPIFLNTANHGSLAPSSPHSKRGPWRPAGLALITSPEPGPPNPSLQPRARH